MQSILDTIGQFFTDIFQFFTDFVLFILALIQQIFIDIYELLIDIPLFLFDSILSLVVTIIDSIPAPALPFNFWDSVPGEVLNMMGLIGMAEALALIASGITIRVLLQLIPFTRLGS